MADEAALAAQTKDAGDDLEMGAASDTNPKSDTETNASPAEAKKRTKSELTEMIDASQYDVFRPQELTKSSDLPNLIMKTANSKITGRLPRISLFLLIPFLFFPILYLDTSNVGFTVARMYGAALFLMFTQYYLHIHWVIFQPCSDDKHKKKSSLFRIYSLNSIIPYWSSMTVSYQAIMLRWYPIESISEIAAIQGGIIQNLTQAISMFAWLLLLAVIALEMWSNDIVWGFGLIAELIGCFGIVLSGQCELDPFNKEMKFFHRVGQWLKLFLFEAYIEQQVIIEFVREVDQYSGLRMGSAILLTLTAVVSISLWRWKFIPESRQFAQAMILKGDKQDEKDSERLNYLSKRNIWAVLIYEYVCALTLCLWLVNNEWCYFKGYDRGCYEQ